MDEWTVNIAKIMIPKCLTVFLHEEDTVSQGLKIIARHGYTAIPVLDSQDCYMGSVSEGDFLRCVLAAGTTNPGVLDQKRIGEILRKDFCPALPIVADRNTVIDAVLKQNYVPIVDGRNTLCGIITRRSVILYLAGR